MHNRKDRLLHKPCYSVETTQGFASLDQSILAKAFRGELVEQDPTDEPASVLLERIRAERGAAHGTRTRKPRSRRSGSRVEESG